MDFAPRQLAAFTKDGYDKGRGLLWQAAWFATQNLLFGAWWWPARWRPAILRAFGSSIGERVLIRHRVRVLWPWKLTVEDDCWIGEGVWLLNLERIVVRHDSCLSQEAFICTGGHHHDDPSFRYDNAPIEIGAGSWIAARAIVLRGSVVPPGTLVPANAVYSRANETLGKTVAR